MSVESDGLEAALRTNQNFEVVNELLQEYDDRQKEWDKQIEEIHRLKREDTTKHLRLLNLRDEMKFALQGIAGERVFDITIGGASE